MKNDVALQKGIRDELLCDPFVSEARVGVA